LGFGVAHPWGKGGMDDAALKSQPVKFCDYEFNGFGSEWDMFQKVGFWSASPLGQVQPLKFYIIMPNLLVALVTMAGVWISQIRTTRGAWASPLERGADFIP